MKRSQTSLYLLESTRMGSNQLNGEITMTTQRWTDEMLDDLASSVGELRESVGELRDNVDGIRITAQALLQLASQQQQASQRHEEEIERIHQRQAESDERFNTLLAEVRYLIQRIDRKNDEEEK